MHDSASYLNKFASMYKVKRLQFIYLTIGTLAMLYVIIRALKVGVTFDEVWTIKDFVSLDWMNILNYTPCDANNHILNTLLIKLFFISGDHSLFIARLPNVLAFSFYLYFGYKICYQYLASFIGICCYLLLLLNPFLLDFFGLARGYGIALGFQLASLYFLIAYIKNTQSVKALWSLIFGALAVIANFSLLNYWLVLFFIIHAIALFFKKDFDFKQVFIKNIFVLLALVAIIYEPIRKLKQNGSLYYGGNTSFYNDTLVSLTKYTFYSPNTTPIIFTVLNIFIVILFLSVIFSFFFNCRFLSAKNTLLLITVFCVLSVVLQHLLLDTLYLIDRAALFFYPLLILSLCLSLNDFAHKWYSKIISIMSVLALGINFVNHANLYKTATWYFDAHSIQILDHLNQIGREKNKKIKLDFSWPFGNSFAYYFEQNQYPFVEIVKSKEDRSDLNPSADYYIYLSQSLEKVGYEASEQKIVPYNKDIIEAYQKESVIIYSNIRK